MGGREGVIGGKGRKGDLVRAYNVAQDGLKIDHNLQIKVVEAPTI